MILFAVIQTLERDKPDEAFPEAQTCYFTIRLPKYSSQEVRADCWRAVVSLSSNASLTSQVMRTKLLWAVMNCVSIDADYVPSEISDSDSVASDMS
jgi:hypothetical protein